MFRLSSRADPAFLAEMLYEAVNWRDDGAEERPPLEELLANPEIRRYVATGECMDKAGAYAIQGRAALFVSRLEGSFSGVVGLPLFETAQMLKALGRFPL